MLKQLLKYGAIKIFESTNLVKSCTCQKHGCFLSTGGTQKFDFET